MGAERPGVCKNQSGIFDQFSTPLNPQPFGGFGITVPGYNAMISFGLPFELEDFPMWEILVWEILVQDTIPGEQACMVFGDCTWNPSRVRSRHVFIEDRCA